MTEVIQTSDIAQTRTAIDVFKRYWRGSGSPAIAFWAFGVGSGLLITLIEIVGFMLLFRQRVNPLGYGEFHMYDLYMLGYVISLMCQAILAGVIIWRCSKNTRRVGYEYLSRGVVILGVVYCTISVVIEGKTFLANWIIRA